MEASPLARPVMLERKRGPRGRLSQGISGWLAPQWGRGAGTRQRDPPTRCAERCLSQGEVGGAARNRTGVVRFAV